MGNAPARERPACWQVGGPVHHGDARRRRPCMRRAADRLSAMERVPDVAARAPSTRHAEHLAESLHNCGRDITQAPVSVLPTDPRHVRYRTPERDLGPPRSVRSRPTRSPPSCLFFFYSNRPTPRLFFLPPPHPLRL